jgi:hypothetical protein
MLISCFFFRHNSSSSVIIIVIIIIIIINFFFISRLDRRKHRRVPLARDGPCHRCSTAEMHAWCVDCAEAQCEPCSILAHRRPTRWGHRCVEPGIFFKIYLHYIFNSFPDSSFWTNFGSPPHSPYRTRRVLSTATIAALDREVELRRESLRQAIQEAEDDLRRLKEVNQESHSNTSSEEYDDDYRTGGAPSSGRGDGLGVIMDDPMAMLSSEDEEPGDVQSDLESEDGDGGAGDGGSEDSDGEGDKAGEDGDGEGDKAGEDGDGNGDDGKEDGGDARGIDPGPAASDVLHPGETPEIDQKPEDAEHNSDPAPGLDGPDPGVADASATPVTEATPSCEN